MKSGCFFLESKSNVKSNDVPKNLSNLSDVITECKNDGVTPNVSQIDQNHKNFNRALVNHHILVANPSHA